MKTTKTLLLAAVSALSIGVGVAMAQSEVPSAPSDLYFQPKTLQAPVHQPRVQAGDSDFSATGHHTIDFTTIANPG